jgi:malonyl CoA-acyl carrier protein transacylase
MGRELFDRVPQFTAVERQANELLGYSLRGVCLDPPGEKLRDTRFVQPCLYTVNALHYYDARAKGLQADFLAGHSLGEYNALLAADVFGFLDGLKLVQKRATITADAGPGAMAAVVGLAPESVSRVLQEPGLHGVDLANINAPDQVVLSGPPDDIARAERPCKAAGARLFIRLPVNAAFHSRYMRRASEEFARCFESIELRAPRCTVISNVTGRPYPLGPDTGALSDLLVKHLYSPVRWLQTVRFLSDGGVDTFKELGPGRVLTRLVEQICAAPAARATAVGAV